ncbi:MAG: YraN family protein [Roseivirga sp.]
MQTFGKKGEDIACDFLINLGYEIIVRNYRFKRSEIDIICKGEGLLIFVEVKTRASRSFGAPESFVSEAQKESIGRGAEAYIEAINWPSDIRFDVVSIFKKGSEQEVFHIKDAFY